MSDTLAFSRRTFPARVADLGFSVRLPTDWIAHELPDDATDFIDPTAFAPLAVVTAPHAVIVLAFGARPVFDDGTLFDWAQYLVAQHGIALRAMGGDTVAGVPAMLAEGTKESEMGTMVVRCAFFEDGGRLVNLTYSAPEQLDSAVHAAWWAAVQSFALESPRSAEGVAFRDGQALAGGAGGGVTAEDAEDAEGNAGEGAQEVPSDLAAGDGATLEEGGMSAGDLLAEPAPDEPPPTFADFALDDDIASLDPEHPINAALRDNGSGFTPRVVHVATHEKRASVAALALVAEVSVPFGWHVMDDGRRTLIFDADNGVQVNLSYLAREGRDDEGMLDALEAEARASYPSPDFVRLSQDGMSALGIRGIEDDGVQLEQYHLLVDRPDAGHVLRARVTARPEHAVPATNMAELILQSVVHLSGARSEYFDSAEAPPPHRIEPDTGTRGEKPEWWTRALALQAAGDMRGAEQVVRDAMQHVGRDLGIAELWALRMEQLEASGDSSGADAAYTEARGWAFSHASGATSGGEGMALSLERDEFIEELGRRLGRVPSAER